MGRCAACALPFFASPLSQRKRTRRLLERYRPFIPTTTSPLLSFNPPTPLRGVLSFPLQLPLPCGLRPARRSQLASVAAPWSFSAPFLLNQQLIRCFQAIRDHRGETKGLPPVDPGMTIPSLCQVAELRSAPCPVVCLALLKSTAYRSSRVVGRQQLLTLGQCTRPNPDHQVIRQHPLRFPLMEVALAQLPGFLGQREGTKCRCLMSRKARNSPEVKHWSYHRDLGHPSAN